MTVRKMSAEEILSFILFLLGGFSIVYSSNLGVLFGVFFFVWGNNLARQNFMKHFSKLNEAEEDK